MKLMILGHARHGKDTAAEFLCSRYGLTFESSSHILAQEVVRPSLAAKGIIYDTLAECYADRVNHRPEWANALSEYNSPDLTRLGRYIYARHDIYVGIRSRREFCALTEIGAFDYSLWIDRSIHLMFEAKDSMKMLPSDADFIVDNNGDLENLELSLRITMEKIAKIRRQTGGHYS